MDSEEWDSISASVYLTKRGDVYVVAVEENTVEGVHPAPPAPSPSTVRNGGSAATTTTTPGVVVTSWATATVTNPDVPARLTLSGLLPERDYALYAYAENGAGRLSGARRSIVGGEGTGARLGTGGAEEWRFSVEPAPSGMSPALVEETRLVVRTAREPDEELDVPWEELSEGGRMAEALAALSDAVVARAAREAAVNAPTPEDLLRCKADPVSRNKWRSFCRWWASSGAGAAERAAFLLRECVFAAQQPEVRGLGGAGYAGG